MGHWWIDRQKQIFASRLEGVDLFLKVFVYGAIILLFALVPYQREAAGVGWTFVWWMTRQDVAVGPIITSVLVFQYTVAAALLLYFVYLHHVGRFLRQQNRELTVAMTSLEVGFCRELFSRTRGRFIEVNDVLLRLLGHEKEAFFSFSFEDICANAEDAEKFKKDLQQKGSILREMRLKAADGRPIWVLLSGRVVKGEQGEPQFFEYIVIDVTERKWMEEEMASAYQRFESVIENTPNIAIQGFALDGKILEWNYASEVLYGFTSHEAVGQYLPELLLNEVDAREFRRLFESIKETGRPTPPREWQVRNKFGRNLTVYSSIFPILQQGHVIEVYRMDVDISDRVEAERRLSEVKDKLEGLALKDPLTEIFNFRYFRERLSAEFERSKRALSPLSIMMIDIDYFKSINDTYGHQFGDRILKQVARFLKTELRSNDVVARWGGEEFAVILPDTNRTDSLGVATKLIELFRTRNFGGGDTLIKLKGSIGVVSYPEDPLFSVEEMIDAGEESIYRVKERGGDGVASYGHEIGERALDRVTDEDRRRFIDSVKQKLSFFAVRSERSILEAVYSLAKSIELRDRRTKEHCDRMVEYAEKVARQLGMNEQDVDNVRRAAMLHDIGKLGISDEILLKPGKLTPDEYEEVRKHPVIGADIISVAGFLKDIVPIILCHHEHWDGKGYPRGLKGEEIPLGARIVAVVDVYEAVTSDRPYHKAIPKKEAIVILREGMGTQFDPQIVKNFIDIIEKEH